MDLVPNFWCHKDFRKVSRLFALLCFAFVAFVLCPRMVLGWSGLLVPELLTVGPGLGC